MDLDAVKPILETSLRVTYEKTDDSVVIFFRGEIELVRPERLIDPFSSKMHEYIVAKKIKKVVFDLSELIFCNSSGIRCFMKWITIATRLNADEQYKIKIISNHEYHWQVTSINILGLIAPKVVSIEIVPPENNP